MPVSVLLGCQIAGIPTFTDLVGTETCPPYRADFRGRGKKNRPTQLRARRFGISVMLATQQL